MGLISKEKYESILKNLQYLKNTELPNVLQQINAARLHGDLSENAEYSAAKAKQREINSEISNLESILSEAEVIVDKDLDKETVGLFAKVRLRHIERNKEFTYQLVSEEEASFLENKISISSSLGKVLKGKKRGDKVDVDINNSKTEFEIIDFTYSNN